jgi:hypothetical protein
MFRDESRALPDSDIRAQGKSPLFAIVELDVPRVFSRRKSRSSAKYRAPATSEPERNAQKSKDLVLCHSLILGSNRRGRVSALAALCIRNVLGAANADTLQLQFQRVEHRHGCH